MHVGIDVHGVISAYPDIFRRFSSILKKRGDRISIITGQEWEKIKPKVDDFGIYYTDHFSIVDYNKSIGTKMWQDEKGTFWMENSIWMMSKGAYMLREGVDLHFDDSVEYAKYIPPYTTYILVPKKNFGIISILFDI